MELRGGFQSAQFATEKGGNCGEDAQLGGSGEPMAFTGKKELLVGDAQEGQAGFQGVGEGDWDDGVGFAMDDERRWEAGGGLCFVGGDEASGDVDDGADAWGGF